MQNMDKKTGLVEVLVVVASLGLAVFILLPVVMNPFGHHDGTHVLSNGRSIYMHIFSTITDIGSDAEDFNYFAVSESDRYDTSTGYFAWLMETKTSDGEVVLPFDFRLFSSSEVSPASDLSDFDAEHNTWSVMTEITFDSDAADPFLVTRNLNESRLVDWGTDEERRLENVGRGRYREPYGDEAIIVIRAGGGGDILQRRDLRWSILNPNRLENPILEP